MSTSEDHEGLSHDLEEEADRLEKESAHLGDEISDVRSDWEAKRQDPAVPGAPPPEGEESKQQSDDQDEDAGSS
jgi:hypothetical protein